MAETNSKPVYRIMDLHEWDRPRERLASLGSQALTNAELIAIILRVGVKGENAVAVGQHLRQQINSMESRMRRKSHVWFGKRHEETCSQKCE